MRPGETVGGKYQLLRRLGAGGMGVIWSARHLVTGRPFAIKFLTLPVGGEHHARFLQEARVSGFVRHPNIVDVYDVGRAPELNDAPYLVMELLDGLSLSAVLGSAGRLSPAQALAFLEPIVDAIGAAHQAGVIHRDIKPSNLFLHRAPAPVGALVPKILDFGISKLVGPAKRAAGASEGGGARLTRTGTVLGSPLYMSPEQVLGDLTLDARSDLHAVGAVLWECLAGEPLFDEKLDDRELAAQIANAPRRGLVEACADCPPGLAALVARCVAVRREERVASAGELGAEIKRLRTELALTASLDSADGAKLFPLLSVSKIPKLTAESTTVDSQGPAAQGAGAEDDKGSERSGSIRGWADKRGGAAETRAFRGVAVGATLGGLLLIGVVVRHFAAPSGPTAPPALALAAAPPPPSLAPGLGSSPPPEAPAPGPSFAPLASSTASIQASPADAGAASSLAPPARPARASASKSAARAMKPATETEKDSGPAAPEALGTSANGAPILR